MMDAAASRLVIPALMQAIRGQFALEWHGIHGASHWGRVYQHGQMIGRAMGADLQVCELFAFLHDSRRLNENHDPQHGPRAAEYAAQLRREGFFEIGDRAFALLQQACRGHSDGYLEADVTVQACWDSDRLDLWRVGIRPDPKYLCTPAARDKTFIAHAVAWSEQWLDGHGPRGIDLP